MTSFRKRRSPAGVEKTFIALAYTEAKLTSAGPHCMSSSRIRRNSRTNTGSSATLNTQSNQGRAAAERCARLISLMTNIRITGLRIAEPCGQVATCG